MIDFVQVLASRVLAKGLAVKPEVMGPRVVLQGPTNDADWLARVGDVRILHLECEGYRDAKFLDRLFDCHQSLVRRYWPRRVQSVALWLAVPPPSRRRDTIVMGDEPVRIISVVVPEIPAKLLLSNPRTACFAPAADPGDLSPADLCRKAVAVLRDAGAPWIELHMAVVAAMKQGRFEAIADALDEMNMEPVIIEDLIKFGEDRGFEQGNKLLHHLFERKLGRPLTIDEGSILRDRFDSLGADRLGDVVLDLSRKALSAWLADPAAV